MISKILAKHLAREKKRLKDYGDGCSMGRHAMSRVHLIERIVNDLKKEGASVSYCSILKIEGDVQCQE